MENLQKKLKEAIDGTFLHGMAFLDCKVLAGKVKTPDGRDAEVHITVTTEEDEWFDQE